MEKVSVRQLRNEGGKVLDRVERGESITVTRDGRDVAELTAVHRALSAEALVLRWRDLPRVDAERLRRDLDEVLDSAV